MGNARKDYWQECIEIALNDCGLKATPEQVAEIAGSVEVAAENMSLAFGSPPNPMIQEVDRLNKELAAERDKISCDQCNGKGWITIQGPIHSATSQCTKCRGEGRHSP